MEIVKIVNGYAIRRTWNVKGFYYVYIDNQDFVVFPSLKAATAFCESL